VTPGIPRCGAPFLDQSNLFGSGISGLQEKSLYDGAARPFYHRSQKWGANPCQVLNVTESPASSITASADLIITHAWQDRCRSDSPSTRSAAKRLLTSKRKSAPIAGRSPNNTTVRPIRPPLKN